MDSAPDLIEHMYTITPDVVAVKAVDNFKLDVEFADGVRGIFDCKPYLKYDFMRDLSDPVAFAQVLPDHGTVMWADGTDLCPDDLYANCVK